MSKHLIASVVVTSLTIAGFADADRIPITIPGGHIGDPGDGPHAPTQLLAQGFYDLGTDALSLSFLQSVGSCIITVTDMADELYIQPFNSDLGTCVMYLPGTPGFYTIAIETAAGDHYYGSFMLY